MRTCARCKQPIPATRLEILPETHTCVQCSTVQQYVGCMAFSHKTAPSLVYVRPENAAVVETLKRAVRRART
jgi:hypothetical protein